VKQKEEKEEVVIPCGQTSVSIRGVQLFLGLDGLAFPSFFVNSASFSSIMSEDDSEIEPASGFEYPALSS